MLGENSTAKGYLEMAMHADANDSVTLFKYALFYQQTNKLQSCEEHFLRSLELNPYDERCLKSYGVFLLNGGHSEEAEKFFQLARRHIQMKSVVDEEIYENCRRNPMSATLSSSSSTPTTGEFSAKYLLITDYRGAWSTKLGTPKTKSEFRLTQNWRWMNEWTVDKHRTDVDSDGFEYATDWNSHSWYSQPSASCKVSRRRWKRTRKNTEYLQVDTTNVGVRILYDLRI